MPEVMLEGAHRYAVAANALMCYADLGAEAEVNAALGLVLLLKSVILEYGRHVEPGMNIYSLRSAAAEDLVLLYARIDRDIRVKLDLRAELSIFVRKRGIAIGRYDESAGSSAHEDNELVYCLGRLIPKAVAHFKGMGSNNAWVCAYPQVREAVELRTGITQERAVAFV
ncbi:hypothetical protein CER19_05070 [Pseudomonas sp. GL93]|uniref:hypothetical protein n=1 Tax=Pseudomonas sp. GL93 TaxID=2014741 RepID=UPI000E31C11F|nr:hypothetical protein [Pseudomonas sp. GL93]RFD32533.1 hypothetical protein CER19_05070 [Pseudomonas sp. GL93]